MLRRIIYQFHLWAGIILGVYLVMLGITGSLLVFGREIDRWLNPHMWIVEPRGERKPLSEILANFRAAYPKARPTYINYPITDVNVYTVRLGPNSATQTDVHIDPYTGKILGDRQRQSSFYGFLCYLHFYLWFEQPGWVANGYGAMLAMFLIAAGVWLWWPARHAGKAVWRARFRVKTTSGRSRLLYDLHNVAGIYPLAFSILFCLTAMEFAFPEPSKRLVYAITGDKIEKPVTVAKGEKALPLDDLVAAADKALDGRIRRVSFPRTATAPLMVRKEWDDWNLNRNHANIAVNPYTGAVVAIEDTREAGLGRKIIQYAIPLHFGIWGGMFTRVLYVLLGLTWVMAFVTGVWHWWIRGKAPAGARRA